MASCQHAFKRGSSLRLRSCCIEALLRSDVPLSFHIISRVSFTSFIHTSPCTLYFTLYYIIHYVYIILYKELTSGINLTPLRNILIINHCFLLSYMRQRERQARISLCFRITSQEFHACTTQHSYIYAKCKLKFLLHCKVCARRAVSLCFRTTF